MPISYYCSLCLTSSSKSSRGAPLPWFMWRPRHLHVCLHNYINFISLGLNLSRWAATWPWMRVLLVPCKSMYQSALAIDSTTRASACKWAFVALDNNCLSGHERIDCLKNSPSLSPSASCPSLGQGLLHLRIGIRKLKLDFCLLINTWFMFPRPLIEIIEQDGSVVCNGRHAGHSADRSEIQIPIRGQDELSFTIYLLLAP